MIMKNGDVYFTIRTTENDRKIRMKVHDKLVPHVPVKMDGLSGLKIRDVQSGVKHVVVLTKDGRVFQWGDIGPQQDRKGGVFEPCFLSGNGIEKERVAQIACGENHALALTWKGEVYSWGNNEVGQLGIGSDVDDAGPTKVSGMNEFNSPINRITCGGWTFYALNKQEGTIWSWGDLFYDDLGYEGLGHQRIPCKIPGLDDIKMIFTGDNHLLALSDEGELYFCGRHDSEQIVMPPRKMLVPNIEVIGATRGCSISTFKTTNGKVYYWGFAFGVHVLEPVATKYSTIVEFFASLDSPVMLGSLKFRVNQPMTEKLKLIFDDSVTGDIKFVVEEKLIHAHKVLLKLRSNHFKRMLDNNWKESGQGEVKITEFTYKGFRTFLLYLYTDQIEPTPQVAGDAIELFKLADYYGEEDLKRRCYQQLRLLITEDNFSQIYSASFQYHSKTLHEIALDLAVPNLNDVVKTDGYKSMSDELQKGLIQELADENVLVGLERKRAKYGA